MIGIRHRLRAVRERGPGRRPVKIEDPVEPTPLQQADVVRDRLPVGRTAVLRWYAVDAEPAVLVEGNAHGVRSPALDRVDRRLIARTVKDAAALGAHVFGALAVDAMHDHGLTGRVHESVALDMKGGGGRARRRCRIRRTDDRTDQEAADRNDERAAEALPPSRSVNARHVTAPGGS